MEVVTITKLQQYWSSAHCIRRKMEGAIFTRCGSFPEHQPNR